MIRKHTKKTPTPAAPPPPSSVATDPIEIIAQHWADVSGLSRAAALNQLALIGHMAMKQNTAGVTELRRELESLIAKKDAGQ